jgi:16S rRNA (guanine527-N7)-methyltransferase
MMEKKRIRPELDSAPKGKSTRGSDSLQAKTAAKGTPDRKKDIGSDTESDLPEMDPILSAGASEIEVPLSGESIYAFKTYARLLKEWNEKMNLTNILDDKGIALRHFIDSLTLVPHLEKEARRQNREDLSLIDVGTGAGFPGIPLKVTLPALKVTLLDSLRKRISFLDAVCAELSLEGIETVHARAEDAGRSKQYREKYDIATARAVASLPVLCELCLPLVKVGGIFLSMKGNIGTEAEEAEKALITLGGTLETLHHFTLPGTDMNRTIIVIRKVRPTPPKYPRQPGKPEKEPIL